MALWDDFQAWIGVSPSKEKTAPVEEQPKPVEPKATPKPDFYERLSMAESSNNPKAKSKTSSAGGLFQFIDSTWKGVVKQHNLGHSLEDKYDPKKAKEAAVIHNEWNKRYLQKSLGYEPTEGQLYAAWFLGANGAKTLLTASPKQLAKEVVKPSQVNANEQMFYVGRYEGKKFIRERPRTVGEVYQLLSKKIGEE